MNDENEIQNGEQDYKSLYEKTLSDLDKVVAKKNELYTETKKAKAAREQAELAAAKAAEEQSKKNGEFEKLWKNVSKENEELARQLKEIKLASRKEKIQVAAMKIATELADGDNAELLSTFVVQNLDSLADDSGLLGEDVLSAITNEFKNNQKFKVLLRGSKASGGGAPGNMRGAQETTTLTRAEFDKLNPTKQMEIIKKIRTGSINLTE